MRGKEFESLNIFGPEDDDGGVQMAFIYPDPRFRMSYVVQLDSGITTNMLFEAERLGNDGHWVVQAVEVMQVYERHIRYEVDQPGDGIALGTLPSSLDGVGMPQDNDVPM